MVTTRSAFAERTRRKTAAKAASDAVGRECIPLFRATVDRYLSRDQFLKCCHVQKAFLLLRWFQTAGSLAAEILRPDSIVQQSLTHSTDPDLTNVSVANKILTLVIRAEILDEDGSKLIRMKCPAMSPVYRPLKTLVKLAKKAKKSMESWDEMLQDANVFSLSAADEIAENVLRLAHKATRSKQMLQSIRSTAQQLQKEMAFRKQTRQKIGRAVREASADPTILRGRGGFAFRRARERFQRAQAQFRQSRQKQNSKTKSTVRIGPVRRGTLSQFGYAIRKPATVRRSALKKAIARHGRNTVMAKVNLIFIWNRNRHPATARVAQADKNWIRRTYPLR